MVTVVAGIGMSSLAWFSGLGPVIAVVLGLCTALPSTRFFDATTAAVVIAAVIIDAGDLEGVLVAGVILCTVLPSRDRPDDALVVVALAALGAYLGPPDTETTYLAGGVALALAGVSAGWRGRATLPWKVVFALSALVALASIDATVGRPQAVYGVLATFSPLVALTLVSLAGRMHPPVDLRGSLWFIPAVFVTMFLGARVFGRASTVVSVGFLVVAVGFWTLGLGVSWAEERAGGTRPRSDR